MNLQVLSGALKAGVLRLTACLDFVRDRDRDRDSDRQRERREVVKAAAVVVADSVLGWMEAFGNWLPRGEVL